MKFFHLSDLHLGKQLHHYNLKEDQEYILGEVLGYVDQMRPDAILIAGDIYDKSVPSAEAVSMFDDFLTRLSAVEPRMPVMIIAGNHDSAKRLDYASRLLGSQEIYIAAEVPEKEEDHLTRVVLEDEYGKVNFYLLPFMKPGYVRWMTEGELPGSYTEAVSMVLGRENVDPSARNVLVSHQFFTGSGKAPEVCDSEMISVGGTDNVDTSAVSMFDYVALGHLHGAQRVGEEHIRYCGTLLKYSVSEAGHRKCLHLVELKEKGEPVEIREIPLHPLRDVRRVRGSLKEIIESADPLQKEDYVSIVLTDEVDPYKPKEQLQQVFSHILEIRVDNERTRKKLDFSEEEIRIENPVAAFRDFYREMHGRELPENETHLIEKIYEEVRGDMS